MLTGDLVRPRMKERNGQLRVQMIDTGSAHWLQSAADLIALLRAHAGQSLETWQSAYEEYEGYRTDYIVLRGLAKVLTDAATFSPPETPLPPAELRTRLFAHGPVFDTPDLLRPHTRADLLAETAAELSVTPETVAGMIYADRPAATLLTDPGPDWTPASLLARYNLELARAALYWSDGMQVQIYDNYKDVWKYIKLFKLMFWATPADGGYRVALDGPISPFVKTTTRYGRQLAAFLPALFLCDQWRMWATVRPPGSDAPLVYHLSHETALPSHFRGSGAFDSQMEADFAAEFHEKFGDQRNAWLLTREDEVILLDDTVMIPDFALTHKKDGRRAVIEIVGFWHPTYLQRKVEKVRAANRRDLILLVYEGVNLSREKLRDVPAEVLYFKNKPVLKDVMAAVERIAC